MKRYELLYRSARELAASRTGFGGSKHLRYLEIGTGTGERAANILSGWLDGGIATVEYLGYDLFEDLPPETAKADRYRTPHPEFTVLAALRGAVGDRGKISLVKGDTAVLFAAGSPPIPFEPDLIFLDGSRNPLTVLTDWAACERVFGRGAVLVLGDLAVNRTDTGTLRLFEQLARRPDLACELSPEADYDAASDLFLRTAKAVRR